MLLCIAYWVWLVLHLGSCDSLCSKRKEGCVRACCVFSLTHLPISQVCALCPPPVDTAHAHHWNHNCRLLKYREGLCHYEKHTQHYVNTVNKENVLVDRLIKEFSASLVQWLKKKNLHLFPITHCTSLFLKCYEWEVSGFSFEKETNSTLFNKT